MFRASVAALLATTSLIASPALAAEIGAGAARAETADANDPIVVVGQREEYGVKSTSTATKTNTDVKDIPQALPVVSEAQIEAQQLRSIADVL